MNKIAVLPGDGIGPEVVREALGLLEVVGKKYGFNFELEEGVLGGAAIDKRGMPFPQETKELVLRSDAVFLGSVGGPKWDVVPAQIRPEKGLLEIRKTMGLYANLRPVKAWHQLLHQSPLKNERIKGVDLLVVRELIGGAYFGKRGQEALGEEMKAFDTIEYSSSEIRRIVKVGFELAAKRKGKLTSVDKANVLDTSRLWRKIADEEAQNYPQVSLNHLYVDNCAMQLCLNPAQFDVIVTENMFGDILSDEASVLGASLGMMASASIGEGPALYEPAHGTAPDIAGQDKANPLATFLSLALMLRISFDQEEAAAAIEKAIDAVLSKGLRTGDIWSEGTELVGTKSMGHAVIEEIKK